MYLHNLVLLAEYLVYILGLLRFLIKLLHLYALLYSFSFVIISFSIYIFFCCILNYVLCNCIDCYSRQVFNFILKSFETCPRETVSQFCWISSGRFCWRDVFLLILSNFDLWTFFFGFILFTNRDNDSFLISCCTNPMQLWFGIIQETPRDCCLFDFDHFGME